MTGGQNGTLFPWHHHLVDDPVTLSEHLVHKMHHDHDPLLITLEDKFACREYVQSRSDCKLPKLFAFLDGKNPTIPWNDLPDRFVLKPNHWSGDSIFIIDNASEPLENVPRPFFPKIRAKKQHGYYIIRKVRDQFGLFCPRLRIERKMRRVLKNDFPVHIEFGAYNIKHRGIMVEEFLMGKDGGAPTDIKFHCFGGKVGFIQYEAGRFDGGKIRQNIHLPDGTLIDTRGDATKWFNDTSIQDIRAHFGSEVIDRMIQVAESVSQETMYVRVDLFFINGEVVFGEFTNYPRSGQPQAPQWEALGGRLWREARGAPPAEKP